VTQLVALRAGKLFDQMGKLVGQAAPLPCQSLDLPDKGLGLRLRLGRRHQLLVEPEVAARIFEKLLSTLLGGRLPRSVESLNFRTRESLPDDGLGQALTGLGVATGQGNEHFHGGLGGDLALTDLALKGKRELPYQSQAPRDPAGAAHKASRQLLLAPAKAMLELGEKPALLQSAGGRCMAHLPLQDQRFGLLHVPDQRVDRVAPEPAEGLDAQIAVDDHVAIRLIGVSHDHDGLLLTVLFQGDQQLTPALAAASAQLGVTHLQLVKLQLHGWLAPQHLWDVGNHCPRAADQSETAAFSV
jgi:hypothetical protein